MIYAFYKKYEYILIALLVLISQLVLLPGIQDFYPDSDNYTHARRVLDLLETGVWSESIYIHSNYPFGEILHFTRITDLFWLFFSLPAFLFFPLKEAVFWGGYIYQTGVLILSALALIWMLKPVASPVLRLIGSALFFVQPSITETFILTKPDHHSLTTLFAFILTGALMHYMTDRREKYLVIAGIGAGLGLWTSVEGLLISYALLAGLVLLFLLNKESVKTAAVYFFYYFISSLVFLILNPPYEGFFSPDNGRLSFLLVTTIGLTTIPLIILYLWEEKGLLTGFFRKFAGLSALTALFLLLLFFVFPKDVVFARHFPPAIQDWANNIIELQSGTKSPLLFILSCWPSIFTFLIGIAIFKFCSERQRPFLLLSLIPLAVFIGFSIVWVRYSRLSTLFTPVPLVLAFSLRCPTVSERKKGIFIVLSYIALMIFLGLNYQSVNRMFASRPRPSVLTVKPYLPQRDGSILADTSLGPELIWTLDENVIGTPYHRNVEGIVDGDYMLRLPDAKEVRRLLKRHHVKAVLLFIEIPGQPDLFYNMKRRYSFFEKSTDSSSLIAQLVMKKNIPCGITEELNTPPPYILYNVDFSTCPDEN